MGSGTGPWTAPVHPRSQPRTHWCMFCHSCRTPGRTRRHRRSLHSRYPQQNGSRNSSCSGEQHSSRKVCEQGAMAKVSDQEGVTHEQGAMAQVPDQEGVTTVRRGRCRSSGELAAARCDANLLSRACTMELQPVPVTRKTLAAVEQNQQAQGTTVWPDVWQHTGGGDTAGPTSLCK